VDRWASGIRERYGIPLPLAEDEGDGEDLIRIALSDRTRPSGPFPVVGQGPPGTEWEGYELEVTRRGVRLEAPGPAGVFYGLQTLGQLLRPGVSAGAPTIPRVDIDDQPRFEYRGMHLDVGRHFFPVSFVKRYIDLLAAYKMNVFHWHLTEDQGWRLEIQAYPRLTEVGSCREETILEKNFDPYVGDGEEHCGFYTQDEVREIVEYAGQRFVTVLPEIEMPGHSVAALAAYPELACTEGPFQVSTRWGVTRDIYCPKEETFDFLQDVLSETMALFPSRYIHIGGDEAPKTAWEESDLAQEVIQREGLADEEELQSWFIRRIEAFLNANGRRLIGWDEILEGGLAPNATVMSWRGMAGGIQAAQEGHDVVMTPTGYAYLDFYQGDTLQEPLAIGGFTPLEQVYAFEPVPPELSPAQAVHVLGAQGNVWTEYMKTTDHVEYMVLPRMLALSEVAWTPGDQREWSGFLARLAPQLSRLDAAGVNFRIPDVAGLEEDRLYLADTALVHLSAPVEGGSIRFTLDGSDPGPASPLYQDPILLPLRDSGTEVAARIVLDDGRAGAIRRAIFRRTRLHRPHPLPLSAREPGLEMAAYSGPFRSVDDLETGTPLSMGQEGPEGHSFVPMVTLPTDSPATSFGMTLSGFLRVPRKGIYTFFLTSDDGSRLTMEGQVVVDHDGPHGMATRSGQIALHRGWHPLEVRYFQAGGGLGLELEVEGPGLERTPVPADWLARPAGGTGGGGSPR
jgi:hexosaminidase